MGHVHLLRMNLHQGAFIHSKVGDSYPGTVISTNRKIDFLIPDLCCKHARNTQIGNKVLGTSISGRITASAFTLKHGGEDM